MLTEHQECVGVYDVNSFYRMYFIKNFKKLQIDYWDAASEEKMLSSLTENPCTTMILLNAAVLNPGLVKSVRAISQTTLKIVAFSNGIDEASAIITITSPIYFFVSFHASMHMRHKHKPSFVLLKHILCVDRIAGNGVGRSRRSTRRAVYYH
jgi:hypothetical protein